MALHVVAGPGCDRIGKEEYVERVRRPDDVVISVGSIYDSLTRDGSIPSSNTAALRMALGLRTVAIRQAREKELSGFVLTSNGTRGDLDRLAADAGGEIRVVQITESQACARVSTLVPAGARRDACEEGVKRRWFGRYRKSEHDIEVDP